MLVTWQNLTFLPPPHHLYRVTGSSVASPICQEGQSERTFPIVTFSSRFFLFFSIFSWFFLSFPNFFPLFPDFWPFFRCQGGYSGPLAPYILLLLHYLLPTVLPVFRVRHSWYHGAKCYSFLINCYTFLEMCDSFMPMLTNTLECANVLKNNWCKLTLLRLKNV